MTVIEKWPEDDIDSLRHILFLKLLQYERKGLTTKPLNRLIPILKKPLSKNLEEWIKIPLYLMEKKFQTVSNCTKDSFQFLNPLDVYKLDQLGQDSLTVELVDISSRISNQMW